MEKIKIRIFELIGIALFILCGISVITGLLVFAYQILLWLRAGVWTGMPLSVLFDYAEADLTEIYHPKSWFGLARILQVVLNLPLSLMLPVFMHLVTWVVMAYLEDLKPKSKTQGEL